MLLRSPNSAPLTRLRLHFSESEFALGPQQRVLFLCPAQALLVADVCAAISDRFIDVDDARVALQTPDGFLVPPHESVSILRDNDELVVVRSELKSKKQKRKHRESEAAATHIPEATSTPEVISIPEVHDDSNKRTKSPQTLVLNPVLNHEQLNVVSASPMEEVHHSDSVSAATTASSTPAVHQVSSRSALASGKSLKIKASKPSQFNSQSNASAVSVQPKPLVKSTVLASNSSLPAPSLDQLPAFIGSQVDMSMVSSLALGTVVLYRILELNNFIPCVSARRIGRVVSTDPLTFASPTSKTSQHLSSFLNSSQTGPRVFRAMHASAFDASSAVTVEFSDITEFIALLTPKGHLITNGSTYGISTVQSANVNANPSVQRDPIPVPSVFPDPPSSSSQSQTSMTFSPAAMEVDSDLSAELALRRQMLQTRAALYAKRRESRFSGPAFGSVSSHVASIASNNHFESATVITPALVEAASVAVVHTGLTVKQRRAARRQRQRQHKQATTVVVV